MDEVTELNRRLDEHSNMLLADSREYARLAADAVTKRNAYDLAKARALLRAKDGTIPEKAAQVTLECEPQMMEARIAEAHLDAMKMRLKAVSDSLSAVQTKARLLKTEADLNGFNK
jgi:hypothetical protein